MQKVYLIMGESGEYDEYSKWPVWAFLDMTKAEDHVAKATMRAQELYSAIMMAVNEDREIPDIESEYDPNISMCHNGTSYFIVEVPLQTD